MKSQLDAIDKLILNKPIEQVLRLPEKHMKEWYHSAARCVKDGVQRAKRRAHLQTNSIRNYFTVGNRNNTTQDDDSLSTQESQRAITKRTKDDQRPP